MFNSAHTYFKRVRFLVNSPVLNYIIKSKDISNLMIVVNDVPDEGTIVASNLWGRVRLVKAQMWATATALNVPASLELSLLDAQSELGGSTDQRQSDMAKSVDQYAYVCITPKAGSSAALWQNATSTGLQLLISAPSGTIIDLSLEVYLNDTDPIQTVNVYRTVWTPTAGQILMNYLDASSSGNNAGFIQPIGFSSPALDPASTTRPS